LASQWTLPAEKKRALDAARSKRTAEEESYDPAAKEAPKRVVKATPKGEVKAFDEVRDVDTRGRVGSIGRSIGRDIFGFSPTRTNQLGEDVGNFIDFVPGVGEGVGAGATVDAARQGDWGTAALEAGGLALGTVPIVGDIASKGLRKFGREALAEGIAKSPSIRAYHGSPHSFDRFSMDKIGTGEGAQAYGHGLYFAESEGVAKSYRDTLSKNQKLTWDGQPLDDRRDYWGVVDRLEQEDWRKARVLDHFAKINGTKEDRIRGLHEYYRDQPEMMKAVEEITQRADAQASGAMYEVNLNADPEDFLDWDKPLNEQTERIRDIYTRTTGHPDPASLEARLKAINLERDVLATDRDPVTNAMRNEKRWHELSRENEKLWPMWDAGQSGSKLYNAMVDATDKARRGSMPYKKRVETATEQLRKEGVPGIKYLDQGSRGAKDGTRNYVVWDDKIIDIVRKYGIAGALSAGLISEEMARQMQQQGDI
jgi:hypothetical protein